LKQIGQALIKRYPIAAFFLIAIAICFVTIFPVVLFIPQKEMLGQILSFYLARVGVYSPVLSGMLISRVMHPDRERIPFGRRLLLFMPVWLAAEVVQTESLRSTAAPGASTIALAVFSLPAALLPAFIVTAAYSGAAGVKQMLSTLIRPRGKIIYYLIALLTFPIVHFVGTGITNLSHGHAWLPQAARAADLVYPTLITFLSVFLFSGGINEESGWRGFAQKWLQAKYSPLVSNLILWLLMVIWHIPNDIMQYKEGGYIMTRFVIYPFITILFGWVYNRTRGSILAPAIFHASMNTMNPLMDLFPITTAGNILLGLFAAAVIIIERMWRKLPANHPAVQHENWDIAPSV